jgi:hypothetical protein
MSFTPCGPACLISGTFGLLADLWHTTKRYVDLLDEMKGLLGSHPEHPAVRELEGHVHFFSATRRQPGWGPHDSDT